MYNKAENGKNPNKVQNRPQKNIRPSLLSCCGNATLRCWENFLESIQFPILKNADQDLMRTLTKERRGQSLLRRCWAASGWSTLGRPGAGTGSAGDSVPA